MKPIAALRLRLSFPLLIGLALRVPLPAGEIQVVARGGDPMPDGNGIISDGSAVFGVPVLSNDGIALFTADVEDSVDNSFEALLVAVPGGMAVAGRHGQQPAVLTGIGEGEFTRFYLAAITDGGIVGFMAKTESNGSTFALMNAGSDPAGYRLHAFNGQFSPDEGVLQLGSNESPNINADGDMALRLDLAGTDGGSADDAGIFRFETGSSTAITPIGQKGDAMPSGPGTYVPIAGVPAINDAGQVAFLASLEGTTSSVDEAVLRGDGSTLEVMAKSGDPLPGGGAITDFGTAGEVAINSHGQVGVPVNFQGNNSLDTIAVLTAPGAITEAARVDGLVPGGVYKFSTFNRHMMLNDDGETAFLATLVPVGDGGATTGIFRDTTLIARDGEAVPQGDGVYNAIDFGPFALNAAGEVVFEANISLNAGGTLGALFFYNGVDVEEILREGDSLAGGTVASFEFAGTDGNAGVLPTGRNGFNDHGEVAFRFRLDSGVDGIAVWSPDPTFGGSLGNPVINRANPTQMRVSFPGIPGIPYKVETVDTLVDGTWTEVVGPRFVNAEGFCEFLLDIAALRFARIVFAR